MNFPILSAIIFIPLIGAIFIFLAKGEQKAVARSSKYVAIFSSLVTKINKAPISGISIITERIGKFI